MILDVVCVFLLIAALYCGVRAHRSFRAAREYRDLRDEFTQKSAAALDSKDFAEFDRIYVECEKRRDELDKKHGVSQ